MESEETQDYVREAKSTEQEEVEERIFVPSAASVPQKMMSKGEEPLTNVQWRQVVEKKAHRGRIWIMMGKEPCVRGMWEYFLQEKKQRGFESRLKKKSRQEYKVSGSANRQPGSTWSKGSAAMTRIARKE